jgi:hypothetical protein
MASGGSLAARPDAGDSNSRRSNAVTFADCQWAWRILRQWAWRVLRQQRGASCASGAAIRAALGNFSRGTSNKNAGTTVAPAFDVCSLFQRNSHVRRWKNEDKKIVFHFNCIVRRSGLRHGWHRRFWCRQLDIDGPE